MLHAFLLFRREEPIAIAGPRRNGDELGQVPFASANLMISRNGRWIPRNYVVIRSVADRYKEFFLRV
jgi:hypothetical protein